MKILVVEDEIKIANLLKKGLQEENFAVDVANDGEKGLSLAKYEEYDVIILDIMLPKMNGLELLKELRESEVFTPVILLTAKDSVEDKVKGLNIGADDYLPKPFSFDELLARINVQIRKNTTKESILTVDNLHLNPYTKNVDRDGKLIELTGKEYSVLEYLMRHKGAIISESQIVSHVWDYDFDGMSNVVAVHIKNLRSKIDKSFPKEKDLIHTIRGLGYKIHE